MKTTNLITLPDGRKLAYAEFGQPDGHPVIYFHGGASSRLEPLLFDELINKFALRFIALDRPGIGQSDPQPDRGFSDCPKDVVVLKVNKILRYQSQWQGKSSIDCPLFNSSHILMKAIYL
jgi:pimeloyl-ACP methyl ester carboxylesterase